MRVPAGGKVFPIPSNMPPGEITRESCATATIRTATDPAAGLASEFLDVRAPPFDDARVQRALKYAVDRGRVAAMPAAPSRIPGLQAGGRRRPTTREAAAGERVPSDWRKRTGRGRRASWSTHGRRVEVCGEAAADPVMVPLMLGLGVDELSAGAARVGELRAQIRSLSLDACRAAAHAELEGATVTPGGTGVAIT